MISKPSGSFAALAVMLVLLVVAASPAMADPYSLGDAADFAVLGFGTGFTDQLQPGALTVNGNVGVGTGGDALLGGNNVVVTGQIIYADPITQGTPPTGNFTTSGNTVSINGSTCNSAATCTGNGSVVQNNALVTSADTALTNMYAAVKGLSATAGSPTGALSSSFTWNGNGGTNVASLTSLNLSAGDTLTLHGGASDFFIFNITGGWSMSASSKIVLDGVSADHVLFNMLETADGGTGADVNGNGNMIGFGIILALDRNVTFDTPGGSFTGRLFSDTNKTIHLFSEANIDQPSPPSSVPEPASLLLLGSGLVALGGFGRKWGFGRRTS